ncbi:MAG: 50S ribosomal protein L18 [Cytophagales bacterium]
MANTKLSKRLKIKKRIRSRVFGTPERPRLSVFRSNEEIYAQVIDDLSGTTIVSASSLKLKVEGDKSKIATEVGKTLAKVAKEKGVEKVVFDRNGYLYHGRVKALADGAREGGLQF